ncbi:hypothetical protein BH23CHL9_BH23CHL9_15880 [soil metagenome]
MSLTGRLPAAYRPLTVQSPPMSTRSTEDRAASRAEARRRARLAARGEYSDPEEVQPETNPAAGRRGGFLQRLFPAAPPLPNRPDPLAGFDRSGPLRPIRERIFLLRSNVAAWLATGVVAFGGFFASFFYASDLLGLIGTFVLFGALIAAGWFGWQRPTLFGTAAAVVSFVLAAGLVLAAFAQQGVGPQTFGGSMQEIGELVLQAAYQAGLGFLGGWYGGYLRRRQTQIGAETRRRR